MRSLPAAIAAHIAARLPTIARQLLWVEARNRETGLTESLGLWTGEYTADFVIGVDTRTYFGAGAVLDIPEITTQAGLEVRTHTLRLSPLAPEVQQLFRGYDGRLAPVEIHRVLFSPEAPNTAIADPVRMFRGWIDGVTFSEGTENAESTVEVTLASHSRGLTIPLQLRRSDQSYRLRGGDRIGRYADVAGVVPVHWGEARGSGSATAPTPAAGTITR